MTIKQLIERLSTFQPDQIVLVYNKLLESTSNIVCVSEYENTVEIEISEVSSDMGFCEICGDSCDYDSEMCLCDNCIKYS